MLALVPPPRDKATCRAATTRWATVADDSPSTPSTKSSTLGKPTLTRKSNRSSNGPENLRKYLERAASSHTQAPGVPTPHGHGFAAATNKNRAGNESDVRARETCTTPSSNGWRNASSTLGANSPSSSKNNTPSLASEISPGRIAAVPPPMRPTKEME